MPEFRYDGPTDFFQKSESDEPIARGGSGTFTQEMVDRYTEQGYRFTPVASLKKQEAETAKVVAKEAVTPSNTGEGAGTFSR